MKIPNPDSWMGGKSNEIELEHAIDKALADWGEPRGAIEQVEQQITGITNLVKALLEKLYEEEKITKEAIIAIVGAI